MLGCTACITNMSPARPERGPAEQKAIVKEKTQTEPVAIQSEKKTRRTSCRKKNPPLSVKTLMIPDHLQRGPLIKPIRNSWTQHWNSARPHTTSGNRGIWTMQLTPLIRPIL